MSRDIAAEIQETISRYGVSIWIKADLETLWNRVSGNQNRPLLNNSNPKLTLRHLVDERYPIYQQADIIVESTSNVSHALMVTKIIRELQKKNLV